MPAGAACLPPPLTSASSRKENHPPQRRHEPNTADGPATIHTAPEIGAWHSSQSANIRLLPVRQRQVFRVGAAVPQREQIIAAAVRRRGPQLRCAPTGAAPTGRTSRTRSGAR